MKIPPGYHHIHHCPDRAEVERLRADRDAWKRIADRGAEFQLAAERELAEARSEVERLRVSLQLARDNEDASCNRPRGECERELAEAHRLLARCVDYDEVWEDLEGPINAFLAAHPEASAPAFVCKGNGCDGWCDYDAKPPEASAPRVLYTVLWENAEGSVCSSATAFDDPAKAHEAAMAMGGWVERSAQFSLRAQPPEDTRPLGYRSDGTHAVEEPEEPPEPAWCKCITGFEIDDPEAHPPAKCPRRA